MRKNKKYDDYRFKEQVILEKIEQGKTYTYLSKKYGIPEGTIITWVYKYKHKDRQIRKEKPGRRKIDENIDYKERYEILKKYLEFLEEVDREKR